MLLPLPELIPGRLSTGLPLSSPSPLIRDLASRPLSTSILTLCVAIYAYQKWRDVPVEAIAVSYRNVVEELQVWRVVTASLSHLGMMHLAFNMSSLYALGGLESRLGALRYAMFSLDLVVLPVALLLAVHGALYVRFGLERYRQGMSAGYSCAIFGLMVVASLDVPSVCPIPFAPSLCFATYELPLGGWGGEGYRPTLKLNAAPFVMLVLTQIVVPRASFLGHLCGLLVGFPLGWGWLQWCTPPLLAKGCALAIALGLLAAPSTFGVRRATELDAVGDLAPLLAGATLALAVAIAAPLALYATAALSQTLTVLLCVVVARALARRADEERAARLLIAVVVCAAVDGAWLAATLAAVAAQHRTLRREVVGGDGAYGAGVAALVSALSAALATALAALALLRRFDAGREQLAKWTMLRWGDRVVAAARLPGCVAVSLRLASALLRHCVFRRAAAGPAQEQREEQEEQQLTAHATAENDGEA